MALVAQLKDTVKFKPDLAKSERLFPCMISSQNSRDEIFHDSQLTYSDLHRLEDSKDEEVEQRSFWGA